MQVVSIISTKGGVGKTTTAANLGGFAPMPGCAMLLDLDVQPTLSSYFTLDVRAPGRHLRCWPSTSSGASSNWCRAPRSRAWTWCSPTTTAAN